MKENFWMNFSKCKNYLVNMGGLYLKNALDMGRQSHDSSNKTGLTANQHDLKNLLAKIWNNQDNLRDEDIKTLEYLSKK